MIITCQQCGTSYHLDETLLKPEGTKVRCTACRTIFTAYPTFAAAPQHESDITSSFHTKQFSQASPSSNHSREMEIPDDLSGILGQDFDESTYDNDGEISHLPPNMVHEIDDDEDTNLNDLNYEESYNEDNFDLSDDTFNLSYGTEEVEGKNDIFSEEIELSPEDLDLVKGYKSSTYGVESEEKADLKETPIEEKEIASSKIFEDDTVSLSEEDLDLGVGMAAQGLASDLAVEVSQPETKTELDSSTLTQDESEADEFGDFEKDFEFDSDDNEVSQIDIGAELDFEFGAELGDEVPDASAEDDLDMELTLDDSEQTFSSIEENRGLSEDSGEDDLTLGLDFEEAFDSEDVLEDEDELGLKLDSEEDILPDDVLDDVLGEDADNGAKGKIADALDEDGELDFDFEDKEVALGSEGNLESEQTSETGAVDDFDLSIDFEDSDKEETVGLSLSQDDDIDLKLDLGESSEEDSKEDDFNLDLELDGSNAIEDSNEDLELSISEGDDLNLGLDFDENDSKEQSPNEDLELALDEEDKFNLELDLDDGEVQKDSEVNLNSSLSEEDDFDLELDLGDSDTQKESGADLNSSLSEEDDFDLELDLGDSDTQKESGADFNSSLSEEDDFNLELDLDGSDAQEDLDTGLGSALSEEDDFNLELDLDGGDTKENSDSDFELSIDEEDSLSLELDLDDTEGKNESGREMDMGLAAAAEENDLELDLDLGQGNDDLSAKDELDFDLDLDEDFGKVDETAKSSHSDDEELELDFSDNQLSKDQTTSDDLDLSDLQDLLDSDQKKEKPNISAAESDDFDLSDLENVLDSDQDDQEKAPLAGDEDLELDLDIESDLAETVAVSSSGKDFSTELDLSEFEYLSDSDEKSPADDHFDTGDMELEFQIEETPPEPKQPEKESKSEEKVPLSESPDIASQKTLAFTETPFTETVEDEDEFEEDSYPTQKPGISKPLVIILVIAILLGGGYCAYVLLDGMGIQIPYLSNYLNPKVEDPGNLKLTTDDINSKFIDNTTAGRMFVITGKVKSTYDKPRRFIQLTGKLFTKGKKLAKTEIVYAGNVISDTELTTLDINLVKKRLADRFGGDQKAMTTVQPGEALPFMVVFSELPKEQLEEFTIEVDKSTEVN